MERALLLAQAIATATQQAISQPAATPGPAAATGGDVREFLIQAAYLAASVLFILGLRGLTTPDKARRGMQLAATGMLVAVIGTLIDFRIVDYTWICSAWCSARASARRFRSGCR